MPDSGFILSIDIGTSAAKAILYNLNLQIAWISRRTYPIYTLQHGWSEQDPEIVVQAVFQLLQKSVQSVPSEGKILAVTFSSQQYSLLAVDDQGQPLTNSMTWQDTRSASSAESLRSLPQAKGIYERTACPIDAIYPLSKIHWLQTQRDFPPRTRYISIKEYVLFKLTGRYIVDWSIASATGLFDIRKHVWDEEALTAVSIRDENLSELVSPRTVLPGWSADTLAKTHLPAGTPLVIGGGDGPLASLGVGATKPDILAINVGTSAAARCAVTPARVDPGERLWTYVADEELWVIGGIVSSGGGTYRWWIENTNKIASSSQGETSLFDYHSEADREAASVAPGADGLLFIPYISGEQCPTWRPQTRGSFLGLDAHHHRGHLARAVLEGITRSLYRVGESISSMLEHPFKEIRVTGGLTSSPVWLQIAADMFGIPVVVPESIEGSARGAAILAGLELGVWQNMEQVDELFETRACIAPDPDTHKFYEEQYSRFLEGLELSRNISSTYGG
jgi:gluconokinase